MEPPQDPASTLQDSVVGGNLHTGNVIHNHYHFTQEPSPQPQPQAQPHQPVYQQVQPPQQQVQTVYRPMVQTVTSSMGNDDELLIAYLIWLFLGIIGGHRFYFGHIGLGLLYLFTAGLFGIGWFVDLFLISDLVRESQRKKAMMLGAGPMYAQR
jgi:TM2 domain-containing membrane protein YozV